MANLGPLAAEIGSGVWGSPADFNGFRVLAALLHSTLVVGVSQTLRGEHHLYLAGRPSRWALAHILVVISFMLINLCSYFVHVWLYGYFWAIVSVFNLTITILCTVFYHLS